MMKRRANTRTLAVISWITLILCAVMAAAMFVYSYCTDTPENIPPEEEYTDVGKHIDENTTVDETDPVDKDDAPDDIPDESDENEGKPGSTDEQTETEPKDDEPSTQSSEPKTDPQSEKQPEQKSQPEPQTQPEKQPEQKPQPPTQPTDTPPKETIVTSATLKSLLLSALDPIGSTLYVYGGGWNEADTAAGVEAMTYGPSKRWAEFFNKNDSSYNHQNALYYIHDGLDCTGYLGYTVFQVFGNSYSKSGYVFKSGRFGYSFASLFGGSVTPRGQIDKRRAGDIMTQNGHVYLVLGQCSDGSVLLAHASPPCVTLTGTCTPSGVSSSEAYNLAVKYMQKIAPTAYERYPSNCSRGISYLTEYDRYRFPDNVLTDPDGLLGMTVDELMEEITKGK